jgi:hypothetical protein
MQDQVTAISTCRLQPCSSSAFRLEVAIGVAGGSIAVSDPLRDLATFKSRLVSYTQKCGNLPLLNRQVIHISLQKKPITSRSSGGSNRTKLSFLLGDSALPHWELK